MGDDPIGWRLASGAGRAGNLPFVGDAREERPPALRGSSAFDLVARYKDGLTDAERAIAESTMRAMFLSMAGLEDKAGEASLEWAEAFWRANRRLFACIWEPRDDPEPADENASGRASAHLYRLHYRFLKTADAIDPDVWDHDRYDVLTGVTWRILRIAAHLASHTVLWSEEHGYPSVRMMFDGFVQLKWMLAVEGSRPGVWDEFKNYGRGRNKALVLQTEAAIERTDGEPREMLERLLPKLRDAANRDIREDFQDIHTTTTFAADDTSLLAMATDVGLQDMYHSLMIPAELDPARRLGCARRPSPRSLPASASRPARDPACRIRRRKSRAVSRARSTLCGLDLRRVLPGDGLRADVQRGRRGRDARPGQRVADRPGLTHQGWLTSQVAGGEFAISLHPPGHRQGPPLDHQRQSSSAVIERRQTARARHISARKSAAACFRCPRFHGHRNAR